MPTLRRNRYRNRRKARYRPAGLRVGRVGFAPTGQLTEFHEGIVSFNPIGPAWPGRSQDNLSTHKPAALYEAFSPQEARRILQRLEFHYTPKHGSWLNMAEIELHALSSQCLDRRIGNQERLITEVAAWNQDRNQRAATVHWQFTTQDARVKLKKLYPSFHA